jgi:hypothetical protein
LNWNDYKNYINEGAKVSSLRAFHFLIIKVQTHWIAHLGQTRLHFMLVTLLGLPLSIFGYWAINFTEFGSFDTSTAPLLSVAIWAMLYYPLLLAPIIFPLHLVVSTITGAFFKEFWEIVEIIKSDIDTQTATRE